MKYDRWLPPVRIEANVKEAVLHVIEKEKPQTDYPKWLRRLILKELEANGIDPYKENES